jgi:hypothetical protein
MKDIYERFARESSVDKISPADDALYVCGALCI